MPNNRTINSLCQIDNPVNFNSNVAHAFIGQTGTVVATRKSVIDGHLYVVKLDTPTPAAKHWSPCRTLAVSLGDMELIAQQDTLIESAAQAVEEIGEDELERFAATRGAQ